MEKIKENVKKIWRAFKKTKFYNNFQFRWFLGILTLSLIFTYNFRFFYFDNSPQFQTLITKSNGSLKNCNLSNNQLGDSQEIKGLYDIDANQSDINFSKLLLDIFDIPIDETLKNKWLLNTVQLCIENKNINYIHPNPLFYIHPTHSILYHLLDGYAKKAKEEGVGGMTIKIKFDEVLSDEKYVKKGERKCFDIETDKYSSVKLSVEIKNLSYLKIGNFNTPICLSTEDTKLYIWPGKLRLFLWVLLFFIILSLICISAKDFFHFFYKKEKK